MTKDFSRYYLKTNQARPYHFNVKVLPKMQETLGGLIQRRMKEVGISSKSELARLIGKSASYVGDLINNTGKTKSGTYKPSPEVVSALCFHLKVSENEILQAIGYKSSDNLQAEVEAFAQKLAESVMPSGYDRLKDADLIEAFMEDMRTIAEASLKRRLAEQEKRNRK